MKTPKLLLDVLLKKLDYGQVKNQWITMENDHKDNTTRKKWEVGKIQLTTGIF